MLITCGTCNGDGFISFGDRHVENRKEVCGECKGLCMVEARTGEVPQASASPDGTSLYAGTTPQDMRALGVSPLPDGVFSVADSALDPLMSIAKAIDPDAFVWSDNADAIKQARQAALEAARRVLHVQAAAKPPVAETLDTIAQWCEETFGPITPERMVERAGEEFEELQAEPSSSEEAADVVICLSRVPGLWEAVLRKMAKNRLRRWSLRGDGTGYHIKE